MELLPTFLVSQQLPAGTPLLWPSRACVKLLLPSAPGLPGAPGASHYEVFLPQVHPVTWCSCPSWGRTSSSQAAQLTHNKEILQHCLHSSLKLNIWAVKQYTLFHFSPENKKARQSKSNWENYKVRQPEKFITLLELIWDFLHLRISESCKTKMMMNIHSQFAVKPYIFANQGENKRQNWSTSPILLLASEEDSWRVRLLINTNLWEKTAGYIIVLAGGRNVALIAESSASVIVLCAHAKSWS